jgi:hypothetical protein
LIPARWPLRRAVISASVLLLLCRQRCTALIVRLLLHLLLALLLPLSCECALARIGPVLDSSTHGTLPLADTWTLTHWVRH